MTTVAEILKSKSHAAVYSVAPQDSVFQALRTMAEKEVGALLVLDGGTIAGIFTERDYARKIEVRGRSSADTRLAEVMTPDVLHVGPATTTQECMALMTDKRLRHLPVLDGGQVVGMVSIGDLVKEIISEQQFMIAQLESYIRS